MQYTTHYNLNLPEGTDIVNPLVQDNPNYSAIDSALYNNKLRVVGNATEVTSGTVHAVTRSDSDIDVFRFTATGNWTTGDSMTVDGTPVSVFLPDGTAPLTGCYVVNSEVEAVINGSRVTLQLANPGVTSVDADDVVYDNTTSGLAATDAQAAIDELACDVSQNASDISDLKKNRYGTQIDITPYNSSSNMYTAPADGYLNMDCRATSNIVSVYVYTADDHYVAAPRLSGIQYLSNCIFIRKGMKMYVATNLGTNIVTFTTLV